MPSNPKYFSSSAEESSDEESSHLTMMSQWNQTSSRMLSTYPKNGLIASLAVDEGHVYSLAAKNNVLYRGSDSRIIRVWSNMQEFTAFKCSSGFVKSIIVFNDKIFTGHQDGKIRVWKINDKNPRIYKLSETLPTLLDVFRNSMKPSNYVQVRRHHMRVWVRHNDMISSLSINQEKGLLYSSSWDRTFKVWNIHSSTCVESIDAHNDAINSIVSNSDHVYTGSADGTVKVWKLEPRIDDRGTVSSIRHVLVQTLLMNQQGCSVTAVAVNGSGSMVYAGSSDGLVNYWAVEKECNRLLRGGGVLKGHNNMAVLCLATGGDSLVLSGSADKSIRVWKRDGGVHKSVAVLNGHVGPVKCLAVEEGGGGGGGGGEWVVYSGSLDKSVKVWRVQETDISSREENRLK